MKIFQTEREVTRNIYTEGSTYSNLKKKTEHVFMELAISSLKVLMFCKCINNHQEGICIRTWSLWGAD